MNQPLASPIPKRMSRRAFLESGMPRELGRFELVNGEVVLKMIHVTRAHEQTGLRILMLLRDQLDPTRYELSKSDFGVAVGEDFVRYPDVLVDTAGGAPDSRLALAPLVVVEVLSDSTADVDLGAKVVEYGSIPSVRHYLVFGQIDVVVWRWSRTDAGWPDEPEKIEGVGGEARLDDLGVVLPLARVYPA